MDSETSEKRNKEPEETGLDDPERDSKKSAQTILQQQITEEVAQLEHHPMGTLLSGFSAGLDIGFGPFLMAVMLTLTGGVLPEPVTEILVANAYSVGFIFVVMGGSALFTEHTTLTVLPVLDRRASVMQLLRLWGLIYIGNIFGAGVFAILVSFIGPTLGVIEPEAFGEIARGLVEHAWWVILLSAIMAGWMMGLVSWLVASGRDTISQVFFVWLVTTGIALAHLHHCIAGTVEVLMGVFAGQGVGWAEFGRFLLWSTLGNIIGGVFFVAIVKYGHVAQSTPGRRQRPGLRYYPSSNRRAERL